MIRGPLYYWAKLYSKQLEVVESYEKLPKTIGIHILNFVSITGVKNYHNVFQIKEKKWFALFPRSRVTYYRACQVYGKR